MEGVVRWADVVDHPRYRISDTGLVESPSGKRLAIIACPSGYMRFRAIRHDGFRSTLKVHREVLRSFVGDPHGRECRHLDGDKTNNTLHNLAWGSRSENCIDILRHGNNARLRLTAESVSEAMDRRSRGERVCDLAVAYGVHVKTMSRAIRGVTWSFVGGV